ncbi:SPFH domain-containing protein [Paenibacillus albiflavus]|uniref:SPFH domain-containing protein n=1 Tax=Paenibacillus albiflavus TaxID=2545760 RepID=A0A4R4E9I1_9BACL|nr:SPFH domain-containing protein [Paenibacillus albiflavus]TCZ75847.1 SPFH domain-containing protein [Paenibacillus albiflavus]
MKETNAWKLNGVVAILLFLIFVGIAAGSFYLLDSENQPLYAIPGILGAILAVITLSSIKVVQPNQAITLTFFGRYIGSVREAGFWMTVPFTTAKKVSLRMRNFNSAKLKVNDINGNPIEIAAVVVFRVIDSAKALFDVDKYEVFVEIQSETALRHVATKYPYDNFDDGYSLRGNSEEVAAELVNELQQRLTVAGLEVIEARLTHLAYSAEIAAAMLQRQQADAIVAARQTIVDGAIGMVKMVVADIEASGIALDEERKAAMINNLMVAIVSDRSATPVINTGSLY